MSISFTDGDTYLGQVAYDVTKQAANRMSWAMAQELRRHDITSLTLLPGLVMTERVQRASAALGEEPKAVAHTPEYVGKAVAALFDAPDLAEFSGQVLSVGDLAARYGFSDTDGRRPPAFHLEGRVSLATRMRLMGLP